jgi:cephalosporin hydroxylase
MKDDRKEYDDNKTKQSVALGQAKDVFQQSVDMMLSLDRFDYSYLWSWMGIPIIQLPADVIETGVARGGSVLFMASLLEMIGKGRVIGIDIDIRAHNRDSIENHPMSKRVDLVEGSSSSEETLAKVRSLIPPGASVMVVLDSDHSRAHVLSELRALAPMVTTGCFLVVADTMVGHLSEEQAPKKRSKVLFKGDEPLSALHDYMGETDRFEADQALNGKLVLSSSPGGYLRCVK